MAQALTAQTSGDYQVPRSDYLISVPAAEMVLLHLHKAVLHAKLVTVTALRLALKMSLHSLDKTFFFTNVWNSNARKEALDDIKDVNVRPADVRKEICVQASNTSGIHLHV